jgi:hypothetical protein
VEADKALEEKVTFCSIIKMLSHRILCSLSFEERLSTVSIAYAQDTFPEGCHIEANVF